MDYLKKHPELITIPIGLLVWILSTVLLRTLDPTSGVFDAGIFQIPIFAVIQIFIFIAVAWILLGLVFGTFKKYLVNNMKSDFNKLSPWQKLKLSYSIFFLLVALLAYLANTLVTS